MLRRVEADTNGRRIAIADFQIDVTHRGVKGAGIRVRDSVVRRHAAHRRKRDSEPAAARGGSAKPRSCEHHHHAGALLESRSPRPEHHDRPCRAVSEDAHAGPHVDRPGNPVASRWHEENALPGVILRLVDRRLKCRAVVRLAVPRGGELGGREIDRLGILQPGRDHRCGAETSRHQHAQQRISDQNVHCEYM